MPSKNALCHFEIMSKDTKKAAEFYNHLFGWKLNFDMGDEYIFIQPENGPGGAISKSDNFGAGGGLAFYIEVDEVENYLKKAVELGGKEVTPKTEIPNIGWHAQFSDLDDNIIGLFMAK